MLATRFELDRTTLAEFAHGVTLTKEKRWRRREARKPRKHIGKGLHSQLQAEVLRTLVIEKRKRSVEAPE